LVEQAQEEEKSERRKGSQLTLYLGANNLQAGLQEVIVFLSGYRGFSKK
jgi:hypothetical protein